MSTVAPWRMAPAPGWGWEVVEMKPVDAPSIEAIRAARDRIAGSAIRSPLIRLNVDEAPAEIYLKLECLQPIGSFKLRGAGNAVALADPSRLGAGEYTAS